MTPAGKRENEIEKEWRTWLESEGWLRKTVRETTIIERIADAFQCLHRSSERGDHETPGSDRVISHAHRLLLSPCGGRSSSGKGAEFGQAERTDVHSPAGI